MKSRVTLITLGVDDVRRSFAFYRDGLGWPSDGILGEGDAEGAVAFFQLESGLRMALWPRASIARDAGVAKSGRGPTDFTLGHNVNSKAEVDAAMASAKKAGARIVKEAVDTFWGGYAGYFADPDEHLWEVAWNPAWAIGEGGAGMTMELDHTIVPAKDRDGAAKRLAEILGVPWGPAAVGPFAGVYINEGTTLDFIQTDEPFPVHHYCFRVGSKEFQAIVERLKAAKIAFRSQVRGPTDYKVDPTYGNVYWNEPEGHMWEILQVSYARKA